MRLCVVILLLEVLCGISAWGQDSVSQTITSKIDSNIVDTIVPSQLKPDNKTTSLIAPKRIGMYSAIIPGLGQALNHQYWKIPIIYLGAAAAGYFIYKNRKNYNEFRSIYIGRLNNDPEAFKLHPELSSISQVQDAMNYYRHYLDLTVALSAVGYALQIIDALVFANLRGFDISPDISFRIQPTSYPTGGVGLGLVFALK